MPFFCSPLDGAQLHYTDHRPSPSTSSSFRPSPSRSENMRKNLALVFLHGWPMSNRMWDRQIPTLVETHGVRCLAPSRRGFGRSEWSGLRPLPDAEGGCGDVTYDTFAADTAALLRAIPDLGDFIFVGSSMGCGESVLVARQLQADDRCKCKGFVWLAPSLPYPLRTADSPAAPPRELWDAILGGLRSDREAFVKGSIGGVFGTQHPEIQMGQEDLDFFVELVRGNDGVAIERCVQLFSRYDFSEELRALGEKRMGEMVPVVAVAGKEDNNWPPEAGPLRIADLIPGAEVQVWDGAAHGLYWTHADRINDLILKVWRDA